MKHVLFVCVHNAGRSQMAEAFLNRMAEERGLDIRATSAGTAEGKALNPLAIRAMEEQGISMAGQHPKLLDQPMVDRADLVIGMGCGVDTSSCPARFLMAEDWGLDDPAGKDIEAVRRIRDEIKARVDCLLDRES